MLESLRKRCCCGSADRSFPVIVNALVWAAMMLASAWLTTPRDGENSNVMMFVLIAGWVATNGLVSKSHAPPKE